MTWLIALLAPFMLVPPIENKVGSCTLDSIVHSKMYTNSDKLSQEQRQESLPLIETYRDNLRQDYCGNCWGTNIRSLLHRTQKEGIINSYRYVHSSRYTFQEKTIVDLQWIADNPWENIIRKAKVGEAQAPSWHTVALIADLWDNWLVYTDDSWYMWYMLLTKQKRDFYVLKY